MGAQRTGVRSTSARSGPTCARSACAGRWPGRPPARRVTAQAERHDARFHWDHHIHVPHGRRRAAGHRLGDLQAGGGASRTRGDIGRRPGRYPDAPGRRLAGRRGAEARAGTTACVCLAAPRVPYGTGWVGTRGPGRARTRRRPCGPSAPRRECPTAAVEYPLSYGQRALWFLHGSRPRAAPATSRRRPACAPPGTCRHFAAPVYRSFHATMIRAPCFTRRTANRLNAWAGRETSTFAWRTRPTGPVGSRQRA